MNRIYFFCFLISLTLTFELEGENEYLIQKEDMQHFIQEKLIDQNNTQIIWDYLYQKSLKFQENAWYEDQNSWGKMFLTIFFLAGIGIFFFIDFNIQIILKKQNMKMVLLGTQILIIYLLTIVTAYIQNQLYLQIISTVIYLQISYKWCNIFFLSMKYGNLIENEMTLQEYTFGDNKFNILLIFINLSINYCIAFTCSSILGQLPFIFYLFLLALNIAQKLCKVQNQIYMLVVILLMIIIFFYNFDELTFSEDILLMHMLTFITQMTPNINQQNFQYLGLTFFIVITLQIVIGLVTIYAFDEFDQLQELALHDQIAFAVKPVYLSQEYKELIKIQESKDKINIQIYLFVVLFFSSFIYLAYIKQLNLVLMMVFYLVLNIVFLNKRKRNIQFQITKFIFLLFINYIFYLGIYQIEIFGLEILNNYYAKYFVQFILDCYKIANYVSLAYLQFYINLRMKGVINVSKCFKQNNQYQNIILIEIIVYYFLSIQSSQFAQTEFILYSLVFQYGSIYYIIQINKKIKKLQIDDNHLYLGILFFTINFKLLLCFQNLLVCQIATIFFSQFSIIFLIYQYDNDQTKIPNQLIIIFIVVLKFYSVIQESQISFIITINYLIFRLMQKYKKDQIQYYHYGIMAFFTLILLLVDAFQLLIILLKQIFQYLPAIKFIYKTFESENQIEHKIITFLTQSVKF